MTTQGGGSQSGPTPLPVGPTDATVVPRYAGPATFARLAPIDAFEHVDIAIVGVPFDGGVSYRPGARFGPAHVRASSRLLRPFHQELEVSPFAAQQVADAGDLAIDPFDLPTAIAQIEEGLRALQARATRTIVIGGDHTLALPELRALAARHGPIAVLHLDAHLDTWDTYFGAPYTHGTPFRRAAEEGLIDQQASCHVGIRGPLYSATDLEDDAALGFMVIRADAYEQGVGPVVERIRRRLGDRPVLVSLDIDVLDPAHAPGTGTPEAGGLTSRELLATLRGLAGLEIVGADVVEVSPAYDHAEITGIAAANAVYDLLGLMALH
jgi:agmatinase